MPKSSKDKIVFLSTLTLLVVFLGVYLFFVAPGRDERVGSQIDAAPSPSPTAAASRAPAPAPSPAPSRGPRSATIRAVGDIMFHEAQLKAQRKRGGYDFDTVFELARDSLAGADYTMGNLEGTIGKVNGKGYTGFPTFNWPYALLPSLKDCGVDMLTLANNHMLDRFFPGIKKTIENIERAGFDRTGANLTQQDRDTPTIVEVNGIKIGVLAYTQHLNGMERYTDKDVLPYCVNLLDKANFKQDVRDIRAAGAEFVIAVPHWGTEYDATPDSAEIIYAQRLVDAGVDAIVGSHPHVVQPIKWAKSKDGEHTALLAYSLGNFVGTMVGPETRGGIILEFTIQEQPGGGFKIEDVGYVPVYLWPGALIRGGRVIRPIPIGRHWDNPPRGMNKATQKIMRQTYRDIKKLLGTKPAKVLDE